MMTTESDLARSQSRTIPYHQLQVMVFNLSPDVQMQLYLQLRNVLYHQTDFASNQLAAIRERRFGHGFLCPYCQDKAIRHGTYLGNRQRYLCKGCRRTFGDFTSSPLHRTHYPEKWPVFLEHFFLGYSLRKSAGILHVWHD